jgi:hypothetical protein
VSARLFDRGVAMNPSRRSSRRRARQPRISQPGELRPEPLEPRQLLATTATLSTEPPPVRLPVTFRGDAAGPITWQSVPTGQLPWLDATGDVPGGCSRPTAAPPGPGGPPNPAAGHSVYFVMSAENCRGLHAGMDICTPCLEPEPCPRYDDRFRRLNVYIPHLGPQCVAEVRNADGCSPCPGKNSVQLVNGQVQAIR